MSALCLYVFGLIVATPLQGGGENFRLASLAICHPPDQNAETASETKNTSNNAELFNSKYLITKKGYFIYNFLYQDNFDFLFKSI